MGLPLIPLDKANHFAYAVIIYFCATLGLFVGSIFPPLFFLHAFFVWKFSAFITVCAFAITKELYDKYSGKGTPEIADAVWTIVPALIILVIDLMK